MGDFIFAWVIPVFRTLNEIFTAAVAITAFSICLFSFQFARKEKLARVFIPLVICLTIIYSADALETTTTSEIYRLYWQKIHWTGFILLPPIYYRFSAVLLTMTGMNSRLRRNLFSAVLYLVSAVFIVLLWTDKLFSGMRTISGIGTAMILSEKSWLFWLFFGLVLIVALLNLGIAFSRTKTHTSRRRMVYLIVSSFSIIIGTFPLLLFGSGLVISQYPTFFWLLSSFANLMIVLMILILGYSVATFSVPWSDRLTRQQMIAWILRGPMTASITLTIVTIVNRGSGLLGLNISGFNSLITVVTIVLMEYLIILLLPFIERNSLSGYGKEDYALYTQLTGMLIFKPELGTFLEALVSALCDKFQARGGFIAVFGSGGEVSQYIKTGQTEWIDLDAIHAKFAQQTDPGASACYISESDIICPVIYDGDNQNVLLAIIGLTGGFSQYLDEMDLRVFEAAVDKARTVLWQRWYLTKANEVLQQSGASNSQLPSREGALLNQDNILPSRENPELEQVSTWVRDALTHYWGGPRLSENPLMQLKVVRAELTRDGETPVNALRTVLKRAMERIRPEGERHYTGEWILYNILDMKFIEGQKVKEVSRKLAMSEADLYRKQKVAIEEIAKTIIQMEKETDERKA